MPVLFSYLFDNGKVKKIVCLHISTQVDKLAYACIKMHFNLLCFTMYIK